TWRRCTGTSASWPRSRVPPATSPSRTRSKRRARVIPSSWAAARRPRRTSKISAMPSASSFDITSTIDFQEVDNALNQARKEVGQRYDFKDAQAEIDLSAVDKKLTLTADDEMKMNALWEIVQTRLVRRGVPVKNFKVPPSEPAAGGAVRRVIEIQQGIPIE